MTEFKLFIGDKNLSSWSLRPWLALKQTGIPFAEHLIRLDRPTSKTDLLRVSPSGRVPCLVDGNLVIWDSLAICEYLAEKFPQGALWPADAAVRARARSVSAEMHSGFTNLRSAWPMNFSREGMRHLTSGARPDIERISEIWESCRRDFGRGGPFLFGQFSIADAMYAPVVSRLVTYGPVDLSPEAARYRDHLWALPAMREWGEGAKAEIA